MIQFVKAIPAIITSAKLLMIAGAVVSAIWFGNKIMHMQKENQRLVDNEKSLITAISAQQVALEKLADDMKTQKQIQLEFAKTSDEQQKEVEDLRNKFNSTGSGKKRDFSKVASEKPVLVEKLINRATSNANRCMELITGAPLNDTEKKAKTPQDFNRECPSLYHNYH